MKTIQKKIDEINDTLSLLEEMEKLEYIVDAAKKNPGLPESEKTERNLVAGCASATWILVSLKNNQFSFQADSEALTVKGMLTLLQSVINGRSPEEIFKIDEQSILNALGLGASITNRRMNRIEDNVKKLSEKVSKIDLQINVQLLPKQGVFFNGQVFSHRPKRSLSYRRFA
jgi:cysteine desulfuration protein SufE